MKANEAPERIYIPRLISDGKLIHEWNDVPFEKFRFFFDKEIAENIEYIRKDAFIENACSGIDKLLSGYIIRNFHFGDSYDIDRLIEDFKKYMKGE